MSSSPIKSIMIPATSESFGEPSTSFFVILVRSTADFVHRVPSGGDRYVLYLSTILKSLSNFARLIWTIPQRSLLSPVVSISSATIKLFTITNQLLSNQLLSTYHF